MLDALLEMLQSDYRAQDLEFAEDLADALLERFEDRPEGGFFFTSHDHEALLQRPKSAHDSAMPAGNGTAAFALQRLGHLTGEKRYLDSAEHCLQAFYAGMRAQPGKGGDAGSARGVAEPPRMVLLRGLTTRFEPGSGRSHGSTFPRRWCWRCRTGSRGFRPAVATPDNRGQRLALLGRYMHAANRFIRRARTGARQIGKPPG